MRAVLWGVAVSVAVLGTGHAVANVTGEEGAKPLPTLLIRGEVLSLDTTDPAATQLKIKDRYGFETPILITADTAISRGETVVGVEEIPTGVEAEVEYNFDVNTAKRYAVAVRLGAPSAEAVQPMPETGPIPAEEPIATPAAPAETPADAAGTADTVDTPAE